MRLPELFDAGALAEIAAKLPRHRGEAALTPVEALALGRSLAPQLRAGTWQPAPATVFTLPKPGGGSREVGRLARADRVVQRAVLSVLQGSLPGVFPPVVHSYVRGRGAIQLVSWLQRELVRGGYGWSLDVVDFFPSVLHAPLEAAVQRHVPWSAVRRLLGLAMRQPVSVGGRVYTPARGLLQGGLLSPWLSNLYLRDVDEQVARSGYRRYCDNLFLAGSLPTVERTGRLLAELLRPLGLGVRFRPSWPVPAAKGLACLGYRVSAAGRRPAPEGRRRLVLRLLRRLRRGAVDSARALIRGYRAYFGGGTTRTMEDVDALLRAGRFSEALRRLEEEHERLAESPDAGDLEAEDAALLVAEIGGDPARHGVAEGRIHRVEPRGLTAEDAVAHVRGDRSVGVLPLDRDGWAHVGVIDVDDGDPHVNAADALRLADAVRRQGRPALVERTGGRGHHVWVPLDRPVPADAATAALEAAVAAAGPAPEGVRRELFPSPPDGDPVVRFPLGRHPRTGERSVLLGPAGETLDGDGLRRVLAGPRGGDGEPRVESPEALRVLTGCTLLGRLARKAVEVAHLGHHERYSLAATLGHVRGGKEAVHAIIGWCDNYDHDVTQHFLERLAPRPLGCRRLKERHPELAGGCACPGAGDGVAYPCPVRFARLGPAGAPEGARRPADIERLMRGLARSLERLRGPA